MNFRFINCMKLLYHILPKMAIIPLILTKTKASWLNVEFKLYLIREFERLKKKESYQNKIEWYVRKELAKTNYRIHTKVLARLNL